MHDLMEAMVHIEEAKVLLDARNVTEAHMEAHSRLLHARSVLERLGCGNLGGQSTLVLQQSSGGAQREEDVQLKFLQVAERNLRTAFDGYADFVREKLLEASTELRVAAAPQLRILLEILRAWSAVDRGRHIATWAEWVKDDIGRRFAGVTEKSTKLTNLKDMFQLCKELSAQESKQRDGGGDGISTTDSEALPEEWWDDASNRPTGLS